MCHYRLWPTMPETCGGGKAGLEASNRRSTGFQDSSGPNCLGIYLTCLILSKSDVMLVGNDIKAYPLFSL